MLHWPKNVIKIHQKMKEEQSIYSFNGKIIFGMSNFYPREVADFCNVQLYQREVTD